MVKKQSPIIVNGYAFFNEQDALLAESERKKVEYLHAHMELKDPDKIMAVYKKALDDRMFKTPIGVDFLREVQTFLIEQCDFPEGDVPAIPLYVEYDKELKEREVVNHRKIKGKKADGDDKSKRVPFIFVSVVLNIALLAAVIAMYIITMNSENPNILNYETNLINQYSSWDQELTEKEKELRSYERELNEMAEELNAREQELNK